MFEFAKRFSLKKHLRNKYVFQENFIIFKSVIVSPKFWVAHRERKFLSFTPFPSKRNISSKSVMVTREGLGKIAHPGEQEEGKGPELKKSLRKCS